MKRAVGAVIVNDLRIVSTGYNGTPFGSLNCNEGGCERCNANVPSGQALDACLCIHAEENAVIEAGRAKAKDGTLFFAQYMSHYLLVLHAPRQLFRQVSKESYTIAPIP